MQNSKPILLIEDDSLNAMMVRRAFSDLKVPNPLVHSQDGEDALEYLRNNSNKKPDIILLDLNMPKMHGIEFLKIIKDDPVLRSIPVVILTTSDDERDIAESFDLNAAGYMIKPFDYENFLEMVRIIVLYWSFSKLSNRENTSDRHEALSSAY
ncbi:MAG: response regulator [Planctomycetota bacterium]|jgi:CheY-like chemotaxis protein